MRTMWLALFVASSCALLYLMLRRVLPRGWATRFGTHLVLSALAIYALNFSGLVTGWYVPLNPGTIGTVAVLGLPGIGLVLGLQHLVLS
ncbi:pro-sigmaK processing inhibitor BofA family protein [Cohnella thermotolerans]|jgi:inhibitor of the pro-sigma K processing machinery|uniref:pro-sigmaK processing inhibitor BofA family protein n=1 Tax=Cohnella thermotolerans TaxID=329858 RepID=UPI000478C841|nr:pro-sigmaK processing inhibitor BofA family protein [Cohnella thermotolerans]